MQKFGYLLLACSLLLTTQFSAQVLAADPVTFVRRAEAAMILLKNAGITVDKSAQTNGQYPDVLDGEWYVPYVVKGLEKGLLNVEKETGLVYPHRSVSRAEFLRMITKAFSLTTNIPYQFTDVDKDAWYTPYAGLAWRYKLFASEQNPNLLQPNLRITHSEATNALYKLLSAEPSLQPEPNMFPVHEERSTPTQPTFMQKLINTIRPIPVSTEASPVVSNDARQIKHTVMQLIATRDNQAEFTRNELIDAVNEVRARYKLQPLRSNYYLELAAQRHAKDMYDRGYFSHFTPEGFSYVERIKSTSYLSVDPKSCSCAQQFVIGQVTESTPCNCEPSFSLGENLAKGQLSVEQVMEDWLNSPNHRKNILRPQFDEIGIGLFGDIWVQEFGQLTLP